MKIIETQRMLDDYRQWMRVEVEGVENAVATFVDGEPEDNTLARNFGDCYMMTYMMSLAYEAGKKGESFEVVLKEEGL